MTVERPPSRSPWPRRAALAGVAAGAALAVGGGLRVALRKPDASSASPGARDILVSVFLRFGVDGLTLVAPAEDGHYRDARPSISIPPHIGLPAGRLDNVPFYFHPAAADLKALFDDGHLAVVHAAGLPIDTRSHFESQEMMERGIAERGSPVLGGWLARHVANATMPMTELAAVSATPAIQESLKGFRDAVAIPDVAEFNVPGGDMNMNVIAALNAGPEPHAAIARETVDMVRRVRAKYAELPAESAAEHGYPGGEFSAAMRSVARLIKMGVGLEVAAVDFGGWDHHYNMNQYFPGHVRQLSKTLAAFWAELAEYRDRLTVVAVTEFGRRLEENTAGGTDHGAASVVLALGGAVAGGRVMGRWPGLAPPDLREGDLRVTTDARQIFQDILVVRRGETAPDRVFPGLAYRPFGLFTPA